MSSLGAILKAAVLAGLIAGAVASAFHWFVIEPVIERAIELEERLSQERGEVAGPAVVDRPTQRWGLVAGLLLYGATWGLLFGVGFHVTRSWQPPEWSAARRGMLLAVLAGWSVSVFPFLKYPANPPGVGDPETIGYRQALYFGFIGLSLAGAALAFALHWLLHRRARPAPAARRHWLLTLGFYAIYSAALYVAMPVNPDPVPMPPQLVGTFRAISLAGLMLFWGVLAGGFGWLCRERAA